MLHLYNTATKAKQHFVPIDAQNIRMYVCGPTVYDFAHIGNARPVVVFDVLYRLLQLSYPQVTYVRNITDVDDKINAAALKNGENIKALTARTTAYYHEDMLALNALPPTFEPRATDHIDDMIAMIQNLIDSGFAYANAGHVLFAVKNYKNYGNLARKNSDELQAGARVEIAPYKQEPGDFVLWKPSADDLPGWNSPWGRGRPGWHIECSAMSKAFLGDIFDIHGGGIDLVFPHHENENAQSCCANNTKNMANFWLHNGHLMVNGSKMSKSLGNFFTVRDLLNDAPGEAIRLALLSTHYRQPLDFTSDALVLAKTTLDRFYKAIAFANNDTDIDSQIIEALHDDLNTPLAIARLHELSSGVFKTDGAQQQQLANTLKASAQILGLLSKSSEQWFQHGQNSSFTPEKIEEMIAERADAKQVKDFTKADSIRKQLLENGIILEDSSKGTTWRIA